MRHFCSRNFLAQSLHCTLYTVASNIIKTQKQYIFWRTPLHYSDISNDCLTLWLMQLGIFHKHMWPVFIYSLNHNADFDDKKNCNKNNFRNVCFCFKMDLNKKRAITKYPGWQKHVYNNPSLFCITSNINNIDSVGLSKIVSCINVLKGTCETTSIILFLQSRYTVLRSRVSFPDRRVLLTPRWNKSGVPCNTLHGLLF